MILKKMAMISSVLMISALPVAALADLVTCNQTDQPSTVKITSSVMTPCSASFPQGITYPGTCLPPKPIARIRAICGAARGSCVADVYETVNCNAGGAAPIGHIVINLDTFTIASSSVVDPTKYAIDVAAGPTITIRKVG